MRVDIDTFSILPSNTIRDAMVRINDTALGIVLVVDEAGHLLGTLTDGDIRRALLSGRDLEEEVSALMNRSPVVAEEGTDAVEALEILNRQKLRHLPVTREDGQLVGLFLLSELAEAVESIHNVPAVLMAGGLGSRLGDLTHDIPKPLIRVGGKPILERIIEHLRTSGVADFFVTTRYLADQIEGHFGNGEDWGVAINYIRERDRLGTAGSLKYLEGQIDEPFLVMNGDLLTDVRVGELCNFHRQSQAAMTVGVRHYAMQVPFGVVEVEDARVVRLSEKPRYEFFVNAGIYMLEPRVLSKIPSGSYFDITELIDVLLAAGETVASFPIFERWLDIGRPEDLERARELLADEEQLDPVPA